MALFIKDFFGHLRSIASSIVASANARIIGKPTNVRNEIKESLILALIDTWQLEKSELKQKMYILKGKSSDYKEQSLVGNLRSRFKRSPSGDLDFSIAEAFKNATTRQINNFKGYGKCKH